MRLALATVVVVSLLEVPAIAAPTAEALYAEGQAAYDRGDHATAIRKWTRSYELSGEPELLFNVAQAHRLRGDCARALATYRRFVALDPTSDQAQLADQLARELEPQCAAPNVPLPTPQARRALRVAGLAVGGAGILSLVGGLALGHRATTLGDEVTASCATLCDWGVLRDKDVGGRRSAAAGYALDAVGATAIVAGAIMYYLGDRERAVTVAPRAREGGAVVSWSRAW